MQMPETITGLGSGAGQPQTAVGSANAAQAELTPEEDAPPPGYESATPEEQGRYRNVVLTGGRLLNDPKVYPTIVEQAQRDPIKAVATATANAMQRAVQHTGEKDAGVIVNAIREVAAEAMEIVEDNGKVPLTSKPEMAFAAENAAMDAARIRLQEMGVLDEAELKVAFEEMKSAGSIDAWMAGEGGSDPGSAPASAGSEEGEQPLNSRQRRRAARRRKAKEEKQRQRMEDNGNG